jgi:hypothetical protein
MTMSSYSSHEDDEGRSMPRNGRGQRDDCAPLDTAMTENDKRLDGNKSQEEWVHVKLPSKYNVFDPSSPIFYTCYDATRGIVRYNCTLCSGHGSRKLYAAHQLAQHCATSLTHRVRMKDLYARQDRIKNGLFVCRSHLHRMEPRIQQLGLQSWRHHVRAEMLTSFSSLTNTGTNSVTGSDLINADALLCEYELLERISLLKMAAWKCLCVTDMLTKLHDHRHHQHRLSAEREDDSIGGESDENHLDRMMEWLSTTWKESKAHMRSSGKIEVIVQHILPFLGERQPLLSAKRSLSSSPAASFA